MRTTRLSGRTIRGAAFCALLLATTAAFAETTIALLDFELKDVTPLPNTPQELERTASIRPMLEQAMLARGDYRLVAIPAEAARQADAGFGYLFEHHDAAAELGLAHGADWILVGRLHKPSFLFAYLMAHLVNTRTGTLADNYIVEVKGPQQVVTQKGVERLAEKIDRSIGP